MSSKPAPIRDQVRVWGPDSAPGVGPEAALEYCRTLAGGHYENFSVVSSLVPRDLRDDFSVVYAFCRWADDLGDEMGGPEASLRLLDWWRRELDACYAGTPTHPVMVALAGTVERHDLPIAPFADLIDAFVQDQHVNRYRDWPQLLDYCRRSADPVGRLVLMLLAEPRTEAVFSASDAICTALQLTNHWQDVARDVVERDRIYLPTEFWPGEDFADRLRRSAERGWAVDDTFLEESRVVVRRCVERTWPFFERGDALLGLVSPTGRPVIRLFRDGGMHVLRTIELWDCETALHRPRLTRTRKLLLVARAWLAARRNRRAG